ncbi:uncharacterized protein F4822DRAFT_370173 [Hypoxylon trugodes]|uniref:uncharacterized protein n=1 Tax=Hypoxylon trugodes TaxID=326681 RepID=UPI00218D0F04|nr:uncharacterized protein F4822DRAFT_370173 [Hypoxylon trugodes]KAI1384682.1 hypothetical protein F4822DRAFT_370173 [Hypoxylon trugodes]
MHILYQHITYLIWFLLMFPKSGIVVPIMIKTQPINSLQATILIICLFPFSSIKCNRYMQKQHDLASNKRQLMGIR